MSTSVKTATITDIEQKLLSAEIRLGGLLEQLEEWFGKRDQKTLACVHTIDDLVEARQMLTGRD